MDSLSPQELLFDSCTSITHRPSHFQLGLLPQSKRIRKVKHSLYSAQTSPSFADSPHDTEDSDDTTLLASRYCVFPAEEKKKILNDLKEFMTQTLDIEIIDETHDWCASFEKLEEKDFILFIQRELPNYVKISI